MRQFSSNSSTQIGCEHRTAFVSDASTFASTAILVDINIYGTKLFSEQVIIHNRYAHIIKRGVVKVDKNALLFTG